MGYLNTDQNIVQAGEKNGSFLGRLAAGMMGANQARMNMQMRKDMIDHQTDAQIRRDEANHRNKAIYGVAGRSTEAFMSMQADQRYFEEATKKGEDGKFVNPAWQQHIDAGVTKTPSGTTFSPQAGTKRTKLKQEYEANHPSPKREPRTPKEKTPKPKFEPTGGNTIVQPKPGEFQGYTPRKTGTGGYDEAYKAGEIDKDTYDSYIEDSKKPGKNYMDTATSDTVNTLVKERQNAEAGRSKDLNDGLGEGKK